MLNHRKSIKPLRNRQTSVLVIALAAVALIGHSTAPAGANGSTPNDQWNRRNVLNVSHAGGDLEAPHSTLFAMKEAVKHGADVLEMDVRLSSDGVLMVHHDDTVDRTTNTTGLVADYSAAELQAMDNAYWFYPDCWSCQSQPTSDYRYRGVRTGAVAPPSGYSANDFSIATLAEIAAAFPDRTLDIEIKAGPTAVLAAEKLAAFINAHGPADRYLVASFDDTLVDYFKTLAPDVPTSPGQNSLIEWFATRGPMPNHRVLQVPPTFSGITVVSQQFVDDAHANGLAVWVWFNGDEEENPAMWQSLVDLGVDALLTGKPRQAQAVLDQSQRAFSVAPTIASSPRVSEAAATVTYSCDISHVATCRSLVVMVAQNRFGRYEIIGSAWATASRGSTVSVTVPMTRLGRTAMRNHSAVVAVAWSANSDTDHTVSNFVLT